VYRATLDPNEVRTRRERKMREAEEMRASRTRTAARRGHRIGQLPRFPWMIFESVLRICTASPSFQTPAALPNARKGQVTPDSNNGPTKLLGTAPGNSM
jgi:hypothetical protein